jgi:hypothetical protein
MADSEARIDAAGSRAGAARVKIGFGSEGEGTP